MGSFNSIQVRRQMVQRSIVSNIYIEDAMIPL